MMPFPNPKGGSRKKHFFPPFEYWVPDFSDFSLPRKKDGRPYKNPDDYEAYLNWLVVHMEKIDFPLNTHHQEIVAELNIQDWTAERLGLWVGGASISQYYWFEKPRFQYPEDFLLNPRPERVCDSMTVEWDGSYYNEDGALIEGRIDFQTYLIFDFMCWQAKKDYERKRIRHPEGTHLFSDLGWRPLLKVAISRTDDWWTKRKTLKRFHDEYASLCMK